MRLGLVIHDLQAGGAERVIVQIANEAARRGWEVKFFLFGTAEADPFFPLDHRVAVEALRSRPKPSSVLGKAGSIGRVIHRLRRALAAFTPDAVLAFVDQSNMLTLLASSGCSWPVYVSERAQPFDTSLSDLPGPLRVLALRLRLRLYHRARRVIVQSRAIEEYYLSAGLSNLEVIPNGIEPVSSESTTEILPRPCIMNLGRLVKKGDQLQLVEAFGILAGRFPEWHLVFVGEGEDRQKLVDRTRSLGLNDRIHFHGKTASPRALLRQADIFALPSYSEGFPNVLLEALAEGRATVSTQCSDVVDDLITDRENGFLVPVRNPTALANALGALMANEELRRSLEAHAGDKLGPFTLSRVLDRWLNLIEARAL